jgi:hypothetical protein
MQKMKLTDREYIDGDECQINKLYKLITDRDRSHAQYSWEWLDTWAGNGFINLLFDEEREMNENLIGQYSLIQVPMSVFGKVYLAGKTENCMSHPDYRGKGIYYPLEKKYFDIAKHKFQIFFTTAGGGVTSAAGYVRRKLGYVAFDSNTVFFYSRRKTYLVKKLSKDIKKYIGKTRFIGKFVSTLVSSLIITKIVLKEPKIKHLNVDIRSEKNAPLTDIEGLWEANRELYGVTINRTAAFLEWRINQNPYHCHHYLVLYEGDVLKGYAIFFMEEDKIINIVDIIVHDKQDSLFNQLLNGLKSHYKAIDADGIVFHTLNSQKELRKVFVQNNFVRIDVSKMRGILFRRAHEKPFHVYISDEVKKVHENVMEPGNWYVTRLFGEGR